MTESTLVLYDLASAAGNKPFSPHTWQVRLALNYKQLPFKTVWLNLVDIKPTLISIVISDSLAIAEYLDETYPQRPIFPEGTKALLALFDKHLQERVFPSLIPILIPPSLPFLAERDRAYFRETRERWLGIKLEDISPAEKREEKWEKLRVELDVLARLLSKNGEGKGLVLGNQASRGDFILVAVFAWLMELDPHGWEKVKTWNEGRWENLWRRSEVWRLNPA